MERPNTVSSLLSKRAELAGLIQKTESDLRRIMCDLDHLDATIRIFDPMADTSPIKPYPTAFRARRGEVTRYVLDSLRKADGPMTSREIAKGLVAARMLNADDATFTLIQKRAGACLNALAEKGAIREVGLIGNFKGWELARG